LKGSATRLQLLASIRGGPGLQRRPWRAGSWSGHRARLRPQPATRLLPGPACPCSPMPAFAGRSAAPQARPALTMPPPGAHLARKPVERRWAGLVGADPLTDRPLARCQGQGTQEARNCTITTQARTAGSRPPNASRPSTAQRARGRGQQHVRELKVAAHHRRHRRGSPTNALNQQQPPGP